MPIIVQQDATIYGLFISVNRSTCFGWCLHSSSGAHITVSTVSGINETVTATVPLMSDTVDPLTLAPDDGWRYQQKHVKRFTDIIKLYIVAYCWTIIGIYFTMHGPIMIWAPDNEWRYQQKHVQRFTDINKLYTVASCWTIIGTNECYVLDCKVPQ